MKIEIVPTAECFGGGFAVEEDGLPRAWFSTKREAERCAAGIEERATPRFVAYSGGGARKRGETPLTQEERNRFLAMTETGWLVLRERKEAGRR